jgi:type I restriction enzyme S subunit
VKLPAYPRYKPSGVEWLGDVPEHWTVVPFKHRCRRFAIYGANISSDEYVPDGVRFLRTTDIDELGQLQPEGVFIEPEQAREYLLNDQDILLSRSGTLGRAFVYRSKIHPACAYAGYLVRFVPNARLNTRFLFHFTKSVAFTDWLQTQIIASTIGNVNGQKYAQCPLPLPEREEQDLIAAFLDRETGRLDRLVAKKRELIERLKEKRAALISRTVTRGLPPAAARAAGLPENPPLKPSNLEWLGDIPKHWKVKPVKFIARVGNGSTPSRDNPAYWEEGDYPWLNSSVANRETVTESEEFVTALALAECHLPKIKPPAVLIGITGQGRTRGMASTLLFEATINQHLAYLKPLRSQAEVGFLRRVFDMAYSFLRSESDGGGSTKGAITCEQIGAMSIPVPPLPEQAAIATYLDLETAKLDALVGKVEAAVERLQEYRTALITAAVTGKIDVRAVKR